MRIRRTLVVVAVGVGIGVVSVVGGTSASGSGEPTPTTIAADSQVARLASAVDTPLARAVGRALGDGSGVRSVHRLSGERADYTDIDASAAGTGYSVTAYARFEPGELGSLERIDSKSGSAWIGSQDPDLASIYYLPDGDQAVGVWIGYQTRDADRRVPSLDHLVRVAERIAADPAVVEAVRAPA